LPIKRNDAEPLSREDVQFDLLNYIFSDTRAVFTSPNSGKVTFGDLYVSALYTSNKCSKVLKEKMVETPAFSIEFAKIALLTNVGRINTTMACKTSMLCRRPRPAYKFN
jgi:Ino eighty subunit 1